MDKDLRMMWAFLVVGVFTLISMCVLVIASQIHGLPQGWFVIATTLATMFSCAMFVAAFIAGVDYMKAQLHPASSTIQAGGYLATHREQFIVYEELEKAFPDREIVTGYERKADDTIFYSHDGRYVSRICVGEEHIFMVGILRTFSNENIPADIQELIDKRYEGT